MPGERRFLYKYHLLCPSQGIDEKFCTINQLLAKWGQALDLNQKSCYYIRRRAYKHKYPHIRIVDIREARPYRRVKVLKEQKEGQPGPRVV